MLQQARPPHVQFEIKAEHYADAAGQSHYRNRYYATITPAGGKDQLYRDAEEWIASLVQKANNAHTPEDSDMYRQWHERFSRMFDQFKAGQEMDVDGTPLRACMAFSPAEVAAAESVKIFTLEELAVATEQAMHNMGIGSRAMSLKAQKVLAQLQDGRVAEENAALRLRLEEMETRLQELMDAAPRRGRPPKEAA